MTFHQAALITAIVIFALGTAYKASAWFRYSVGLEGTQFSTRHRIKAALTGIVRSLFSRKILTLIRVFFVEVIFQRALFRENRARWFMHMNIYSGFTLLFLLHALDNYLVAPFYNGYASTLNPFLFLREIGGVLIVAGIVLAVHRRFLSGTRRPLTSLMDIYAIGMVTIIILSGFLLEAVKITSDAAFQRMADEYTIAADEEDILALKAYWVENLGVVSTDVRKPFESALLEKGKAVHEANCLQCHADPRWGFGAYAVSFAMRPLAPFMDRARLPDILTWVHFLSSIFLLAYLPFSKMIHILTSPLSLLANAVMTADSNPANVATRQMLELDACTHCGACTLRCSVAIAALEIPNTKIFPSEKIGSLKRLASGKQLEREELRTIQQGIVLCTNCNRCGVACPVGIRLTDLWSAARERLFTKGIEEFQLLSPLAYYRGLQREKMNREDYKRPLELAIRSISGNGDRRDTDGSAATVGEKQLLSAISSSIQANSLSNCYSCGTCSNSCPVVRNYKQPGEVLGLLPHQMMHAIGMRCWDLVFGSRMLWDCLGCYQCQESCPQCVAVTDIMFELKNRAISRRNEELDI